MTLFSGSSDKFGYYSVGNEKTYSKLDAIKLMEKTGTHLTWNYNDEIFSSYNWSNEPAETLEELYRQRAEQLRNKYDYIVLFFSGGADSTSVLDTFIDNNIHLDELCSYVYYEGNKSTVWRNDGEISQVAIPYAQKILDTHPLMKHRVVDLSQYAYNYFSKGDAAEKFMHQSGNLVMATSIRESVHEQVPFYKDYVNSGKSICFLRAMDKPRVFEENGRYFFQFIDMFSPEAAAGTTAPIEFFYWGTESAKLLIKQAHIIKRYLEQATPTTPFMTWKATGASYKIYNGKKLWLTVDGVHTLIYNTWNIKTYTVGKTPSPVFNPMMDWLFKDKNATHTKNYADMVKRWWGDLPTYWRNNPNDIAKGSVGCLSQKYYLN